MNKVLLFLILGGFIISGCGQVIVAPQCPKDDLTIACSKMKSDERDFCYLGLALAKSDPNLCKEIQSGFREGCYTKLALRNNDSSLCENTSGNFCYLDYAKMKRDASFCDKIRSDFYKDLCHKELDAPK